MNDVMGTIRNMVWNLTHRIRVVDVIDILIVAIIIYELLLLTRHTRGSALLKGLFLLLIIAFLSNLLGLVSLNWLLNAILQNGAIVLVVLFQPEFRKALERMGRSRVFQKSGHKPLNEERDLIISEIIQTIMDLSKRRVGALIVFEQQTGLEDVIETGTRLNAEISAPLLENIFEPNTPLHDGAVVIRDNEIMAAACILPLAEASGVSRELGTRHRAAVGISENTDAIVLVVSEETGIVSMARDGHLTRPLTVKNLEEVLGEIYTSRQSRVLSFFKNMKEDAEGETDE
ncbi:MAG: diadenylate cyclase CdaA [Clostridia bacterium]|jgi:diadenylate cyclase|nr:diadenylate cyclase CdaA [Clostridia bacterium]